MTLVAQDIAFTRERLLPILDQVIPLAKAHAAEIHPFPDMPLQVNHAYLERSEQNNCSRFFTVRTPAALVGYCLLSVMPNTMFMGSTWAVEIALYLDPDWRKVGIGDRFIAWQDEQLATEPIQVIIRHASHKRNHGPLLHRRGYRAIETGWAKRLAPRS